MSGNDECQGASCTSEHHNQFGHVPHPRRWISEAGCSAHVAARREMIDSMG